MSQMVILEDGTQHMFPDDATETEMNAALPQTQIEGMGRLPAMGASKLAEGGLNLAGLPGNIANLYDAYIGAPFARAVSGQSPEFGKTDPNFTDVVNKVLPTSQQLVQSADAAGITNRPDLKPQGYGEELFAEGMKGVGSTAPFALAGGLPALANTAAQGFGSGVGGQLAKDYLPDWLPGKEIFGSLAGGLTAGGMESLAERGVNAATGKTSQLLQAYKEAGVTPRMVGDLSENPTLQTTQAFASKAPFGAGKVRDASQQTLDEFGNSIEKLADRMGPATTYQEAGTKLQEQANRWIKDFKVSSNTAWEDVNTTIGKTTPVVPRNLRDAINKVTSAAQGNPEIQAALTSGTLDDFINILKSTNGGPIPWSAVSALRSKVGEDLTNPMLIGGSEQGQAKLLYGALTKDMQNTAILAGPQAAAKFAAANKMTSQGHDFVDDILSGLVKDTPEGAAKKLLSSGATGGTMLQAVRQQLPEAADDLGAAALRRMAAGESQASGGNAVSPSRWLSNQDPARRLSPEAAQALFPSQQVQKKMQALDKVASSMRETEKLANPSNTSTILNNVAMWTAPHAIGTSAYMGYQAGGIPGAFGMGSAAALPYLAGPLSGNLVTSPALARLMATPAVQPPFGLAPSLMYQSPQLNPQEWNR